jgi:HD-like signal output (HDOD) protein/CheY-like chemotaxis protein
MFVDDEVQILKSLKRLFMDTEYEILTAQSGPDALKLFRENDIDIAICDMRMPVMDGYQLLHAIKRLHPKVIRVILSGYADESIIFKALQQNVAKIYVFKPWNNEMLLKLVEQLFETEQLLSSNSLSLLINEIEELPTIKESYRRILNVIEKDADLINISNEIEKDQSIATKVLQVANSAYYGVKTGSINQAVTYIGLRNLRSLILSTSIIDEMGSSGNTSKYISDLWKHAFITNKILILIYEKCFKKKLPEIAAAAGLLHNIGIVFMIKNFYKKYCIQIYLESEKKNLDTLKLEKDTFNLTHQEMGGYLLKWWELPFPVVESALYHHNPFDEKIINKEIVHIVHIAQKYAWDQLKRSPNIYFYEDSFHEIKLDKNIFEDKLKYLEK